MILFYRTMLRNLCNGICLLFCFTVIKFTVYVYSYFDLISNEPTVRPNLDKYCSGDTKKCFASFGIVLN